MRAHRHIEWLVLSHAVSMHMIRRAMCMIKITCEVICLLFPAISTPRPTPRKGERPEAAAGRLKTLCGYNGLAHRKVRSDRKQKQAKDRRAALVRLPKLDGLSLADGCTTAPSGWHSTACCLLPFFFFLARRSQGRRRDLGRGLASGTC